MVSDEVVVTSVQRGDADAFRELLDRHGDTVYAVLRRLVRDPDLAEELAQETFVRAYRAIGEFRGRASVATWLVQIAVNLARDLRRTVRRQPVLVPIDREAGAVTDPPQWDRDDPESNPLHQLERKELAERLDHELARLPAEYREVFVLKNVHGHSYEEISRMTGDSAGTLRVRAHRCRAMLRRRLRSGSREAYDGRAAGQVSRWRPVR